MSKQGKELYEFGPFRLDAGKRVLLRDNEPVPLQLKALEMLVVLVRSGGEVVLKDELMKAVWPDSFVEESNLAQNVFVLRKTLGAAEKDKDVQYIVTIPGRGYRFAEKVRIASVDAAPLNGATVAGVAADQKDFQGDATGSKNGIGVAATRGPVSGRRRWMAAIVGVAAAAVVGYLLRPVLPPARATRIKQITAIGTLVHNTRLLTDGPRIYFRVWQDKTRVARAISTEGGDIVPVASSFAAFDIYDISPDGSQFLESNLEDLRSDSEARGRYATLWRVPVASGSPQPVGTLRASDSAWSPDGATFAYAFLSGLWLANVDGSHARKIADLPDDPFYFAWSPDGQRLRFTARNASRRGYDVWEANLSSGVVRPMILDTPGASSPWAGGWTADGKYFFYTAISDGTRNIWAVREKDELLHRVNHKAVQITNGPLNLFLALPGRDGKRVFAVGEQGRGQILRYDVRAKQFTPHLQGISIDQVAYSPDGESIACIEFPQGTLVRSRADGTERRQLTFAPMRALSPQWSADGKRIAFQGRAENGAYDKIYVIDAEGGRPELAAADAQDRESFPSWTADGGAIVYSSADAAESALELRRIELKTRTSASLPGTAGFHFAQISPDGGRIAAVQQSSGALMLYDTTSHATRTVAAAGEYPHWSADGKFLYFNSPYFSAAGVRGGVYRWNAATESIETVVMYPDELLTGAFGVSYGVMPDGGILLVRDVTTRDLYSVDLVLP